MKSAVHMTMLEKHTGSGGKALVLNELLKHIAGRGRINLQIIEVTLHLRYSIIRFMSEK